MIDPIIISYQVDILAVGAIQSGAKGEEKIKITIGCDHRFVDGIVNAKFLRNKRIDGKTG